MNTWLLLSESRSRILRIWNVYTGLVLFFVLAQTVMGKLAGIEGWVWLWFTATLIPGLSILNANAWLNKSPAKILHPGAHRAMLAAAFGYLTLVFCVLFFSQAAIEQNDYGLDTWFKRSFFLLLPFQALVLLSFWLLYFKKESIFSPNPQIILDLANRKSEQVNNQGKPLRLKCLEMMASNDLLRTFECLKTYFQKNNLENLQITLLLNGEYSALLQATQLNTIDPALAQRNLNRVAIALLELLEEVNE